MATENTPARLKSYAHVQLAGRLVADPELRFTGSGKAVCTMRVATNEGKSPQYHRLVAWEEIGQAASTLRKAAPIVVTGRLQNRSYKTADGSTRYVTEIVVAEIGDLS